MPIQIAPPCPSPWQVILSKEQKQLILDTVSNFEGYKKCRKRLGMDDIITYGAGMVMLFYGPPGTGKTMMANALANQLKKKVGRPSLHRHCKEIQCCVVTVLV